MRTLSVGTLSILLLAGPGCTAPDNSQVVPGEPGQEVDALFSHFTSAGSPGAAVMVIREGEVLHAKGYGLADLESGRVLTRETPFRLASVTKQFTTMAIMILKDRGLLEFDDPAAEWIPELRRFPGVTVRHLMQHTSGLPDYYDLPQARFDAVADSDGDPVFTHADAVTLYESWGEPVTSPGSTYRYCNPCYEVLGLIVERASGQAYESFLAEHVFEPLGMETAAVRARPESVIPNRAVGYRMVEGAGGWVENDDHPANWLLGAGGVYASLDDLYAWDQALYTEELVTASTLRSAFAPTVLENGDVSEYGFGWNVGDRLGRPAVHHGGSWVGFRTNIVRFTEEALTVIVLSNASASVGELADRVAEVFLDG